MRNKDKKVYYAYSDASLKDQAATYGVVIKLVDRNLKLKRIAADSGEIPEPYNRNSNLAELYAAYKTVSWYRDNIEDGLKLTLVSDSGAPWGAYQKPTTELEKAFFKICFDSNIDVEWRPGRHNPAHNVAIKLRKQLLNQP